MRLLAMCEVRRTADSHPKRIGGQARPEQEVSPEDGGAWGGWRRNVRKCMFMNQGYLSWCWKERGRSQSPRSSDEAGNRPWSQGGQEGGSVKETQLQINLPGVPKAKQGREVPQQWAWTEASVWTERMLATLERGIKGGKWFSLMDKVWKMENLQSATEQVLMPARLATTVSGWCHSAPLPGQFRTRFKQRRSTSGRFFLVMRVL